MASEQANAPKLLLKLTDYGFEIAAACFAGLAMTLKLHFLSLRVRRRWTKQLNIQHQSVSLSY